jgi:hypothetical protein
MRLRAGAFPATVLRLRRVPATQTAEVSRRPDSMNVCIRILYAAALAGSLSAGHAWADLAYTKFDGPAPNVNGTLVSGINNNNGVVDGVTLDAGFNHQGLARE